MKTKQQPSPAGRPRRSPVKFDFPFLKQLLKPGEISVDQGIVRIHQRAELRPGKLVYADGLCRDRQSGLLRRKRTIPFQPVPHICLPFQFHSLRSRLILCLPKRDPDQIPIFLLYCIVFAHPFITHPFIIPLRHLRNDIHPVPFLNVF